MSCDPSMVCVMPDPEGKIARRMLARSHHAREAGDDGDQGEGGKFPPLRFVLI